MAFQGVPFNVGGEVLAKAYVTLEHIPKILIDNGSNGFSLGSILSSLVAGGIPAVVAILVMRNNNKILKEQIQTQLLITEKTIKAQLVSSNRKEQINTLRDLVSEYFGMVSGVVNSLDVMLFEEQCGRGASEVFHYHHREQLKLKQKIGTVQAKIKILLDPDDERTTKISSAMTGVRILLKEHGETPEANAFDKINELFAVIMKEIYEITKIEWGKVERLE